MTKREGHKEQNRKTKALHKSMVRLCLAWALLWYLALTLPFRSALSFLRRTAVTKVRTNFLYKEQLDVEQESSTWMESKMVVKGQRCVKSWTACSCWIENSCSVPPPRRGLKALSEQAASSAGPWGFVEIQEAVNISFSHLRIWVTVTWSLYLQILAGFLSTFWKCKQVEFFFFLDCTVSDSTYEWSCSTMPLCFQWERLFPVADTPCEGVALHEVQGRSYKLSLLLWA